MLYQGNSSEKEYLRVKGSIQFFGNLFTGLAKSNKGIKFFLNFKDNGLSSSSRLKKLIFLGIKTLLINNLKLFLKMFILKL